MTGGFGQASRSFGNMLDGDQQKAAGHRGSNLLIVAGAGSGKTRALTYRALSLLDNIAPENLMIVTFTKKAAKEIHDRIISSITQPQQKEIHRAWIGTIHSICRRILLENGHLVSLRPGWSVLDMPDSERVMSYAASGYGITETKQIKEIYALYSYARNSMMDWRKLVSSQRFPNIRFPDQIGNIIESYNRRCRRSNRVDFDDLQVLALNILESNQATRNAYRERFRAILVDEYQDTNLVESRILKLLDNYGNISVVGDDSQAIYSFRAATVENILNYEKDFTAQRVTLGTNYRSSPGIVNLANASINNNPRLIPKTILSSRPNAEHPKFLLTETPAEEAQFIIREIDRQIRSGIKRQNIAVLFRVTRQAAILETELTKAGIPYILVGGDDFFTLEHIKVVMDMVRLLVNPDDSIALGSVQSIVHFSDFESIEQTERKAEQLQLSFWDVINTKKNSSLDTSGYEKLGKFRRILDSLKPLLIDNQSILPLVSKIIEFLTPYYESRFATTWEDVQLDLGVLSDIASTYTSATDFVNSIALEQFQEDPSDLQNHPITLTTIHSAKGLEWDVVFVIGLVEFWFPLKWAIQECGNCEEERRLFYVAVTRAKDHLYLTSYSRSYNPYGKLMEQQLSRFITELPYGVYQTIS